MAKIDRDRVEVSAKLLLREQHLPIVESLISLYGDTVSLGELRKQIVIDIDIYEYTLKRDRINRHRPE